MKIKESFRLNKVILKKFIKHDMIDGCKLRLKRQSSHSRHHFLADEWETREVREAWELEDPGRDGGFDDGLPLMTLADFDSLPEGV